MGPNSSANGELTVEEIISIQTPEAPVWSPDGSLLAYRQAGFGTAEIWLSDGAAAPEQITSGDSPVSSLVWAAGNRIIFLRGYTVHSIIPGHDAATVLTLPEAASGPELLPGGDAVAYVLGGDVYLHEFGARQPERLTSGECLMTRDAQKLLNLLIPSPDGRYLAIQAPQDQGLNLAVYDRQARQLDWIAPTTDIESHPIWAPDSTRLAFTRYAWTVKWRELWIATPDGRQLTRIHRNESDRWVSRFTFDAAFAPTGDEIAFAAPVDNFSRVLVAPVTGGDLRQVSPNGGECSQIGYAPDGNWISYISDGDDNGRRDRHTRTAWIVRPSGEERRQLLDGQRVVENVAWSPDSRRVALISSTVEHPNQLAVCDVAGGDNATAATHLPATIGKPVEVHVAIQTVRSEDGRWDIPVLIMRREDLPADGNAPAIIHVHGGGQGQYVLSGWGGYTHRGTITAMHYRLAQRGFVIFDVDYRGSWNYGQDYEVDSYLDVGGGDRRDVITVARWVGEQPEVDPARIGLWGRSYGGYMTTLCMVREPDLFRAGVNVVGVFNWVDYYNYLSDRAPGTWSRSRFERPEDHSALYDERNPLNEIDRLSKPYLALYGLTDYNVPIDHCWQMVRAMTEAAIPFDMVLYPDEPHIFTRRDTWRDALTRIDRFFSEHLASH